MALHNRIILILSTPVMIFLLSLYSLWTIELIYGLNTPAEFNFRDPKELGWIYNLLAPVVYLTAPLSMLMVPVIVLYVIYQCAMNKKTINLFVIFMTIVVYIIFFPLVFWRSYWRSTENPMTAFYWFLD